MPELMKGRLSLPGGGLPPSSDNQDNLGGVRSKIPYQDANDSYLREG